MDTPLLDALNRACPFYGAGSSNSVLREILLDPEVAGLIAVAMSCGATSWTLFSEDNHINRIMGDMARSDFKESLGGDFRERYSPPVAYEQRSEDWESRFSSDGADDISERPVGVTAVPDSAVIAWSHENRLYANLS
jgi:hypothetical protein